MASLIVKPRSRIFSGHDWVFRGEIAKVIGEPAPGSVITIKDVRGRPLGSAIYNPNSLIVARRFSAQRQDLDADFFRRRIQLANELRDRRKVHPGLRRIVWSESDGLPGLIVDRYDTCLVFQTLTLAMDQRTDLIAEVLWELFSPAAIVERSDGSGRTAEGLQPRVQVVMGDLPEALEVAPGGIRLNVDLIKGQKTGVYLDQLHNHGRVAAYCSGLRVLDCFSNTGLFALAAAKAGASSVTAVEIGAENVQAGKTVALANGLNVDYVCANAFDYLKEAESTGASLDMVILDPPSFTRNKQRLADAKRGYKEIHLRALKILQRDGLLATFSCSHHMDEAALREVIVDAAADAKKSVRIVERFSQGPDHPVLPHIPETEYLRGYLLEVMPGR